MFFRKKRDEADYHGCGLNNDCCDESGTPRILIIGRDDAETRMLHHGVLEASDRCKTPLLVELSYDIDVEKADGKSSSHFFHTG